MIYAAGNQACGKHKKMNQHYQDIKELESSFAIEEAERNICKVCSQKLQAPKSKEMGICAKHYSFMPEGKRDEMFISQHLDLYQAQNNPFN